MGNLPQHAAFKVAKKYDDNGGVTSPKASVDYGTNMLRFRDASILLIDDRLYNAYRKELEPARPVHTSMKAIALRTPLGDVLTKDGKQTYVQIKEGGLTELIQVDDRILTPENLRKSSQLIKAELNWQTAGKGDEYVTRMLEGNDQISIAIPNSGWNNFKDIQNLLFNETELREGNLVKAFMKEYGNLQTYLYYQDKNVAGGLVSAGYVYYYRRCADVPQGLSVRPGVLIYADAKGAKVEAAPKPEASPKQKETQPIVIATTQEMKELVAQANKELANVTTILKDGMLDATQKIVDLFEKQIGQ